MVDMKQLPDTEIAEQVDKAKKQKAGQRMKVMERTIEIFEDFVGVDNRNFFWI